MHVEHESEPEAESRTLEATVGRELRQLRIARGWTQKETAARLAVLPGYETWHQTTIARVESADRPLRLNEAETLATLFGVTIADLTIGKISAEDAAGEIAKLEPELQAATEKLETAKEAVEVKAGRLQELVDARDEAFFAQRRIQARLDFLRRRVAALAPPAKGSGK